MMHLIVRFDEQLDKLAGQLRPDRGRNNGLHSAVAVIVVTTTD